ncbi:MAG: type-F conjugative transfer system protein TraW [Pseudomonadota bacterium]
MRFSDAALKWMSSLALSIAISAHAESLGTVGPVYPIQEPDLLERIHAKLKAKQASGEIERRNKEAQEHARSFIEQPTPLAGITTVTAPRTFFFNPSIVLDRDIADQAGRVIVPAGTRVNPLDKITLSRRLFFFDARDSRQVAQAKAVMDRDGVGVKLVLVAGSYMDLMRKWKRRVYFDQQGELTQRLGIHRVPALVGQEGKRLRIDELMPGASL